MECPRCRHENEAGAKFCEECAASLARTCANCGRQLSSTAKFCPECAHPTELSAATPTVRRFGSPEGYTPKHLAEKILSSRGALEGERKQITVLFADTKGSMELLVHRDPEDARKLLDPVVEHMIEAVHRYEGTVNHVMGDGIMALFGAPLAHEDHAVRACYAALRMQDSVNRYAVGVRRTEGISIQIRVGLNSGEVVVRSIGSDLQMDYTVVGQTTHLAARMEQLARPGTTLLTDETLELAKGLVEVESLGPVPVKGLAERVETYRLVRASPVRSRLQALSVHGLTRFVGRDAELENLRRALEMAREGHGQVVAVVGQPGVGKSRLFWEFTHSHRTEGWLLLESGSASYGKATPYLPLIEFLRVYFQIEPQDDTRKIREKVTGKVLTLDEALRPTLGALLALLEVPVEDAEWSALDPPQRRQRTLQALWRLVLRESHVQPLCLVFEDLHWIDSETQAFLDSLVETLPTARLLLLVNYRPEYQHGWGNKTYYTQLRLDPLGPESANEFVSALLGCDQSVEPLKQILIERTLGNPFFLEESIRTLVETKALVGERGAYRLVTALPDIQVPPTVQAVLAARIDRLPGEDKRLTQCVSVIGETVPFAILQVIAEMPEVDLRQGLSRLQAAELLYETRLFPDLEYTFKHGLTHQVAYNSLLHTRRRALHAKIMEAIEGLYAGRITEHVDRLAHHATRGEMWEKGVTYLRQAGAKAMTRSAYREAITSFEQALAALVHLPPTRDKQEQAIDLCLEAGYALIVLGELEKALGHLREAAALAETLGDRRRLAWISAHTALHLWMMGQSADAVAAGRRAVVLARETDDLPLQAMAGLRLGLAYHSLGDYRQAIDSLEWSRNLFQSDQVYKLGRMSPTIQAVQSRAWLAWCLAEVGQFADAIENAREALRIAEAANHPTSLVFSSRSVGVVHLRLGEIDRALPALERAVEVCRIARLRVQFDVPASFLGHAYALSGRLAEALPLLKQAVADPTSTGRGNHPLLLVHLAEAHLLASDPDQALAVAQQALDLAQGQQEAGNEAWVLRLLGEIAAHADPPHVEAAQCHYYGALARAKDLGMRPLQAHCHFALGRLYLRTGDRAKAEEHLTTAAAMYRDMDMAFYLAQAEAALKALAREPGDDAGAGHRVRAGGGA